MPLNRDQIDRVKAMCQSGNHILIEAIIEEVGSEYADVKWEQDKDNLIYAIGKRDGARQALIELHQRIIQYAKDSNTDG